MGFTSEADVDKAFNTISQTFASNKTKSLEWRAVQLKKTWWMLEDNKERIAEALHRDLHKHRQESLMVDVYGIQTACLEAIEKMKGWAADDKPQRFDMLNFAGGARVRKEPKGTSLIISAWNYPFMELFEPMISAIAAGCTMVLKPSELAEASQDLIAEIVPQYLDQDAIRVVTAGSKGMDNILAKPWGHVFFTGSTAVGKIVYSKAAVNLTSVTLELGGQSPAIVTAKADIDLAAKRIAGNKFLNAGQVCIGVNHVLVDPSVKKPFIASLIKYFDQFGSGGKPDYYTRIINERNFNRLDGLLEKSSGKVVYGGDRDVATRHFAPTIVDGVPLTDSLMSEELFGPILPIIDATMDEAIGHTNSGGHPLAIYGFTDSAPEQARILDETSSGGAVINDCAMQILAKGAPFGGVGASGTGAYHGVYGFNEFTHLRTVLSMPRWIEGFMEQRYPPYNQAKTDKLTKLSKPVSKVWFTREGKDKGGSLWRKIALVAALAAMLKYYGESLKIWK